MHSETLAVVGAGIAGASVACSRAARTRVFIWKRRVTAPAQAAIPRGVIRGSIAAAFEEVHLRPPFTRRDLLALGVFERSRRAASARRG